MNKKVILCGVVASTLLSGSTFFNTVSAAEIQENKSNVLNHYTSGQQGALQDIDQKMDTMIASIPPNFGEPYKRTTLILGESMDVSGINLKENNVTNITPLYMGQNTFVNETNGTQTYATSTFSEEITKTTSTQIQNGFKTGITTTGKVGIPFVAEGEVSTTLEYNFSKTDENSTSVTKTIAAPPQSVTVPAGKTYKCEVYFEKKKTSGTVELYADVLTGVASRGRVTSIGDALGMATNKNGIIPTPTNSDKVRVVGNGNFSTEYGTNLIVKTYDVTAGKKSVELVDTKIIPIKNL